MVWGFYGAIAADFPAGVSGRGFWGGAGITCQVQQGAALSIWDRIGIDYFICTLRCRSVCRGIAESVLSADEHLWLVALEHGCRDKGGAGQLFFPAGVGDHLRHCAAGRAAFILGIDQFYGFFGTGMG